MYQNSNKPGISTSIPTYEQHIISGSKFAPRLAPTETIKPEVSYETPDDSSGNHDSAPDNIDTATASILIPRLPQVIPSNRLSSILHPVQINNQFPWIEPEQTPLPPLPSEHQDHTDDYTLYIAVYRNADCDYHIDYKRSKNKFNSKKVDRKYKNKHRKRSKAKVYKVYKKTYSKKKNRRNKQLYYNENHSIFHI